MQVVLCFLLNRSEIPRHMDKQSKQNLLRKIRKFAKPNAFRSYMQLGTTTFVLLLCVAMTLLHSNALLWVLTWLISLVMLMRLVIVQHDCGHNSFLSSRTQNKIIGYALGIPTTIPFGYWCLSHNTHHRNQSNLDARSETEYPTLTVAEFKGLSPREKRRYKLTRSAFGVCFLIPLVLLLGVYRFPNAAARNAKLTLSMLSLDLILLAIWAGSFYFVGPMFFGWVFSLHVVLMSIAFIFFYFQHQYEDAYWASKKDFDFVTAGLQGSSFLQTSRFVHWCTGNIGYHHIHHLCWSIPNYALPAAHLACLAAGHQPKKITLWEVPSTFGYALWDSQQQKMVKF